MKKLNFRDWFSKERRVKKRLEKKFNRNAQEAETELDRITYQEVSEEKALIELAELLKDEDLRDALVSKRLRALKKGISHIDLTINQEQRDKILRLVADMLSTTDYKNHVKTKIRAITGNIKKTELAKIRDIEATEEWIEKIRKQVFGEPNDYHVEVFHHNRSKNHIIKALKIARAAEINFQKLEELGLESGKYNSQLSSKLKDIQNLLRQGMASHLHDHIDQAWLLANKEEDLLQNLKKMVMLEITQEKKDFDLVLQAIKDLEH